MGYSLGMMANFQSGLLSRIFSFLWNVYLHRKTLNDL